MTKPYYSDDYVTLYHGDCREMLPTLDQPNAIVSDPPYGIALENHDKTGASRRRVRDVSIVGDTDTSSGQWIVDWCFSYRVVCVVFASPWRPWRGEWRNLIVWDKGGAMGAGGDTKTTLKRTWELVQVANNGEIHGARVGSVWRVTTGGAHTVDHIAAKPVSLMSRLISTFIDHRSIICDPFMGSGSTLVAAKSLGRRAIGIEIEERYCEIAARRLSQGVLDFGGIA